MKLLYITDALAVWGGIERVLRDKMNYLVEHYGYDVYVVTTDQGNHPIPYPLDERIHMHDLGIQFHHQYKYHGIKRLMRYWRLNRLFKERLKNYIEEVKPDVIDCIRIEFVSSVVSVKGSIPFVCESHSLCKAPYFEDTSLYYRLRLYMSYRKLKAVDMMVALTQGDANDWSKYCKNVCVIPNVVQLNNSGRYSCCDSKIVIFVGRFSDQKDVWSLLEIWTIVYQRHPDWELHMYGEGELKTPFEKAAKKAQVNIKIFSPTSAIFEKYLNSSLLIMTSRYEPFGLVLPEAMSCGIPVVAFDCPYGPADIVKSGENGFIVPLYNVVSFANFVCQLIENPRLRMCMGESAPSFVKKYHISRIMPIWNALYEKLLF